jgi:hypothetical protein
VGGIDDGYGCLLDDGHMAILRLQSTREAYCQTTRILSSPSFIYNNIVILHQDREFTATGEDLYLRPWSVCGSMHGSAQMCDDSEMIGKIE